MERKVYTLYMPPKYKCRYCSKEIIVDPKENRTLFFVKDKKGAWGNEFECRTCYTDRVVGPMSTREAYRAPRDGS